ncbi:MAG: UDP-N-acetylmuramate--L-alanine ligase [Bacteroidia bacterium]
MCKTYRFLGIGGVGMAALAQHLAKNACITGYDREAGPLTNLLAAQGIEITFMPQVEKIAKADEVIYTPAIPPTHPEFQEAQKLHKPLKKRAQKLAEVLQDFEVIAIAGAHGKTTISALCSWILTECGKDPTCFIGGMVKKWENVYRPGMSPWAVVEADEFDKSFLHLSPTYAVISSIDPDHLEVYHTPEGVVAAYQTFAQKVKTTLFTPLAIHKIFPQAQPYHVTSCMPHPDGVEFTYQVGPWQGTVKLPLLGVHNAYNAAAALGIAQAVGIPQSQAQEALRSFPGIHRRLEVIFTHKNFILIDDYAHHPNEIRASLDAVRMHFPKHYVFILFQPHLYSRTRAFAAEFACALEKADGGIIFDIYAAREISTEGISSKLIFQHLRKEFLGPLPLTEVMEHFPHLPEPAVVITMGAGDVYRLIPDLIRQIKLLTIS